MICDEVDDMLRTCGADPNCENCLLETSEGRSGVLESVRVNVADERPALREATFATLRDRFEKAGADAAEVAACTPESSDSTNTPLRYPLVSLGDFESRPVAPDLVAGVLPLDALALLVAPPAAGKSAVALGIAASVACAQPFLGRGVRGGHAVYILGEGQGRFGRRTRALLARPELDPQLLHERLHLILQPVPLTESVAVQEVLRSIATLPEPPGLIVVDTLSRCFGSQRDENKQNDMGAFVAGCDALRQATGGCVLVLHHVGASGERARGSTVLGGAVDIELSVATAGLHVTIADTKAKDGPGSGGLRCRLVVIETPEPDEATATGVVAVPETDSATGDDGLGGRPATHGWVLRTLNRSPFHAPEGSNQRELRNAPAIRGYKPQDSSVGKVLNALIKEGLVQRLGRRKQYRYRLSATGRAVVSAMSLDDPKESAA